MTETLYYKDNYLKEFETKVVDCIEENGNYKVVLEETAFYPEGGGQNCDIGFIDGIRVTDVQEKDNVIYHTVEQPIQIGKQVIGKIDFENRFTNMQHHTAEHIVSGLICKKYNAENVGFHMGKDFVTMDYNINLSKKQIEEIEILANEAVYKNIDIKVTNYKKEEIKDLKYRSKKELEGTIRIVEIPGYDICACCGIHVAKTGEIGIIKLLSVQKYKTGCRISLICGNKALMEFNELYKQIDDTATILSIKHDEVYATVKELLNKNNQQKQENLSLKEQIFNLEIRDIPKKKAQLLIKENLSADEMKMLCNKLLDKSEELAGVFSKNKEVYRFQIMSNKQDLREMAKEITNQYNGKGGGSANKVQGQIYIEDKQIEEIRDKYFGVLNLS